MGPRLPNAASRNLTTRIQTLGEKGAWCPGVWMPLSVHNNVSSHSDDEHQGERRLKPRHANAVLRVQQQVTWQGALAQLDSSPPSRAASCLVRTDGRTKSSPRRRWGPAGSLSEARAAQSTPDRTTTSTAAGSRQGDWKLPGAAARPRTWPHESIPEHLPHQELRQGAWPVAWGARGWVGKGSKKRQHASPKTRCQKTKRC